MNKRIAAILTAVTLGLLLAACGANEARQTSSAAEEQSREEQTQPGSGQSAETQESSEAQSAETSAEETAPSSAEETLPQIPDRAMKVLAIGNETTRDSLFYLAELAKLTGNDVWPAYLFKENGSLRNLSRVMEKEQKEYVLNEWDAAAGCWCERSAVSVQEVLASREWDAVLLTQGQTVSGFPGTYGNDLEYVTDVIRVEAPGAKIYWSMNWAFSDGISAQAYAADFGTYYTGESAVMYNAIADCVTRFVAGENARYGDCFDGLIPTGAAIRNLRGTGLTADLDGAALTLKAGRLTAALTVLKTLVPEADWTRITPAALEKLLVAKDGATKDFFIYNNDEASLALVKAAAADAAAAGLPTPVETKPPLSADREGVITTAQAAAPLKLHFPDVKTLADGTLVAGCYENVYHVPRRSSDTKDADQQMKEGVGRLVFYCGSADAQEWHYDEPILVVDQDQMEAWGLVKLSDRYARLQQGERNCVIFADPRDPNLAVTSVDLNGDGAREEILLVTFWNREYRQDATNANHCYLLWGYREAGKWIWSAPQELTHSGSRVVKRGDIAVFADEEILVPYYSAAGCLRMKWDAAAGKWQQLKDSLIPNLAPSESSTLNEVSLTAPDPAGNTVYAFCRESGAVLKSENRGASWTLVGNEPGLIHQPGFTVLGPDRVFVTWARTTGPRWVYGKVFFVGEGHDWSDTETRLLYQNSNDSSKDMADPSCTVLADGRVLVIAYDTSVRSIVAVIADPDGADFQPKTTR